MRPSFLLLVLALASFSALGQGQVLTEADAARRILDVSTVATASLERTAAADAAVKAARAAALPSIGAAAVIAERSSVPEFSLPFSVPGVELPVLSPNITETYTTELWARQAIYTGGAITAQRKAAESERVAAGADLETTRADLRLLARTAYWEVVRAQASVAAAVTQETRALQLVSDTKATFEAGLAVRADVLAAEERAARAKLQVIRAGVAADNAMSTLRSLLALQDAGEIKLVELMKSPLPAPPTSVDALKSQALAARPELAALSARQRALSEREQLARAAGKPSVSAQAHYDYANPNARYFPLTDEWKSSWAVSLGATFTVFDGGKWRADVAASRANQRAVDGDLAELRRRVLVDVENAARDLKAAIAAVASADAAHAASVESEKAAIERRDAGLASLLEVLDAQSQLAGAEQEQIQVRAGAWLAAARLDRTLGR